MAKLDPSQANDLSPFFPADGQNSDYAGFLLRLNCSLISPPFEPVKLRGK